jgi:hypothetical protein
MNRLEEVLDRLPKSHMFEGEFIVVDDAGAPTSTSAILPWPSDQHGLCASDG